MNVNELIGELRCIEINGGRAKQKRDLIAGKAILRGTVDEHHFMNALSWEKMVYESWQLIRGEPGAERVLAICRDEFGNAASETLQRLRDRHSVQLDCEPSQIAAMPLLEFVASWKLMRTNVVAPSETDTTNNLKSTSELEVFVSYAWNDQTCKIVDLLESALEKHKITLLRDREEIRYKDSIREFMKRLGSGKCIVAVISDKYLKSESCMFELVEIAKSQKLRERIFPIMLQDANLYRATGIVNYVNYWESEIRELDEALKTLRQDNLKNLHENLNLYTEIRRLFDDIVGTLRDMNALSPDQHMDSQFDVLIQRIRAQIGA